ncbi:MAG: hypothetical protein MHM6MM_006842, partial [Cercozoa sp. M6MM]
NIKEFSGGMQHAALLRLHTVTGVTFEDLKQTQDSIMMDHRGIRKRSSARSPQHEESAATSRSSAYSSRSEVHLKGNMSTDGNKTVVISVVPPSKQQRLHRNSSASELIIHQSEDVGGRNPSRSDKKDQ